MRLQIHNASKAPDSRIFALIRYAATFFPSVTGKVRVRFSETKNQGCLCQRLWGGFCRRSLVPFITVNSTLNDGHPRLPFSTEVLGYFRSSQIPVAPYSLTTPDEIILHVAAHEFAHLTSPGTRFRKSRIEVYCENRATEVLEASRTPEGQAWIAAERARMEAPSPEPTPHDIEAEKRAALDKKAANVAAKLKRWQTKAKRAATAIKKLTRQQRRLEKQLA